MVEQNSHESNEQVVRGGRGTISPELQSQVKEDSGCYFERHAPLSHVKTVEVLRQKSWA